MKVLIIGGSGLVGGNIYTVLSNDPYYRKITATHLTFKLDHTIFFDPLLTPPSLIKENRWDIIIHTGALTNVDKCETEPTLSYNQTVQSTKRLLALAKENESKLIYLSTDYVFDGQNGPYTENQKCSPINIYGQHKLEAEEEVLAYTNHLIIRITNVYGDEVRNKNFIARVINDLKDKNKISISAPIDQYATPVNATDVANAINLLIKDNKKGIYHISSTDYLSRVQLLQALNKHYNNRVEILPKYTSDLNQVANRPLAGGLISSKFMLEYPDFIFTNVNDYLQKIKNASA